MQLAVSRCVPVRLAPSGKEAHRSVRYKLMRGNRSEEERNAYARAIASDAVSNWDNDCVIGQYQHHSTAPCSAGFMPT